MLKWGSLWEQSIVFASLRGIQAALAIEQPAVEQWAKATEVKPLHFMLLALFSLSVSGSQRLSVSAFTHKA